MLLRSSTPLRFCTHCCVLAVLLAGPSCKSDTTSTENKSEPDFIPPPVTAETEAAPSPTSAPAVTLNEAIPTIAWQDAPAYMDEEVTVIGRIAATGKSKTGHVFLNFVKGDRQSLTIFIDRRNADSFPHSPASLYRGKVVKVDGFVYDHNGTPNISVSSPAGITILPNETAIPQPTSRPTEAAAPIWTPTDGTITLGTYNTLNLFDNVDDPYHADSPADEKPREQMKALAESIRKLNADVLALEEVENRGVLERFNRALLAGMNYEVVLIEGNDNRGIDVALLTRVPVGDVTSHRHLVFPDAAGKPMRFRRDLLEVQLLPPGHSPFTVFVVHLKSKGGDENGSADTRMGEANEARKVLDEKLAQNPKAAFVICGDFNDTVDSDPVRTIIGKGPGALISFINDLPADDRVSFNQEPFLSMIDFVLASPAMAARYVPKSYHIVAGGSPETTGSDHNPVVAKFKVD